MRSSADREEPQRTVAERRVSPDMETWREAHLPAFPIHFPAGRCSRPLFLWTWKQRFAGLGGARKLETSDASAGRRHTANYR